MHLSRPFSQWLDAFRWMAALSVLLAHSNSRLLANLHEIPSDRRSLVHYAYEFANGFSHQGVMIFFVLSGFLVGGSALAELRETGSLDLRVYIGKRLARLWTVLVPVLFIGLTLDTVGIQVLDGDVMGIYGPDAISDADPVAAACNAAFLNTFVCGSLGSNGALWSIAHEFWYYVLFAALLLNLTVLLPMAHRGAAAIALVGLAVFLTATQFDAEPVIPYMLVWLLGVWASHSRTPLLNLSLWTSVAVFLAVLVGGRVFIRGAWLDAYPLLQFGVDVLLGLAFANLLVALRRTQTLRAPPGGDWHVALAGFSFSLYCLHMPLLNATIAALAWAGIPAWRVVPDGWQTWAVVGFVLALAILCAWLLSLVTERHTATVRRWFLGTREARLSRA